MPMYTPFSSNLNSYYSNDEIHPNRKGTAIIAKMVISTLYPQRRHHDAQEWVGSNSTHKPSQLRRFRAKHHEELDTEQSTFASGRSSYKPQSTTYIPGRLNEQSTHLPGRSNEQSTHLPSRPNEQSTYLQSTYLPSRPNEQYTYLPSRPNEQSTYLPSRPNEQSTYLPSRPNEQSTYLPGSTSEQPTIYLPGILQQPQQHPGVEHRSDAQGDELTQQYSRVTYSQPFLGHFEQNHVLPTYQPIQGQKRVSGVFVDRLSLYDKLTLNATLALFVYCHKHAQPLVVS